jgi:molecular chaperone GrpE
VKEREPSPEREDRDPKGHSKDGKEPAVEPATPIKAGEAEEAAEAHEQEAPPGESEAELPEEVPGEVAEAAPAVAPEEVETETPEEIEGEAKEEITALRQEADEYLDGWQRARAEFANYKRRTEREMAEIRGRIRGDMLVRILPVVDDLDRALRDRPAEGEAGSWANGIELIYRKLLALLESEGVQEIEAQGESFDPNLHEALSHEESEEHAEGEIIDVIQKGYRMGERVLRPALVRVAK